MLCFWYLVYRSHRDLKVEEHGPVFFLFLSSSHFTFVFPRCAWPGLVLLPHTLDIHRPYVWMFGCMALFCLASCVCFVRAASTGGAPRNPCEGCRLGRQRGPVSRDVQLDRRPRRRVRAPEHGDGRRGGRGQQAGETCLRLWQEPGVFARDCLPLEGSLLLLLQLQLPCSSGLLVGI